MKLLIKEIKIKFLNFLVFEERGCRIVFKKHVLEYCPGKRIIRSK